MPLGPGRADAAGHAAVRLGQLQHAGHVRHRLLADGDHAHATTGPPASLLRRRAMATILPPPVLANGNVYAAWWMWSNRVRLPGTLAVEAGRRDRERHAEPRCRTSIRTTWCRPATSGSRWARVSPLLADATAWQRQARRKPARCCSSTAGPASGASTSTQPPRQVVRAAGQPVLCRTAAQISAASVSPTACCGSATTAATCTASTTSIRRPCRTRRRSSPPGAASSPPRCRTRTPRAKRRCSLSVGPDCQPAGPAGVRPDQRQRQISVPTQGTNSSHFRRRSPTASCTAVADPSRWPAPAPRRRPRCLAFVSTRQCRSCATSSSTRS